jgi:hypothetical protein
MRQDGRIPGKERVLALQHGGAVKVYRMQSFPGDSIQVRDDTFLGRPVAVIGSAGRDLLAAFHRRLPDGTLVNLTPLQGPGALVAADSEGNAWDIFGYARSGPRTGERLPPAASTMGYWFVWPAFYEKPQIYAR